MRKKLLRSAVLIPLVLMIGALSGPAFATPLIGASAKAYGLKLDLLGANLIPETPTFSVSGINQGADNLVEVDLSQTAFVGAAGAKAITRQATTLDAETPANFITVTQPAGAPKPALYNAQAYARTAGAVALASEDPTTDAVLSTVRSLLGGEAELLAVDGVSSEALVSCVAGQPVFAGGTLLTGVELLGASLTDSLDGTVNQVVDLTGSLLNGILGARVVANEQVQTGNSLSVNGLHVTIPGIIDVIVAHSEVSGATCAPVKQCDDGIDNDGDGKIDFPNDPECKSADDDSEAPECSNAKDDDGDGKIDRADPGCYDNGRLTGRYDPNDDNEADLLPRTGGDNALMGFVILAGGGLMLIAGRKLRRSEG